MQISALARGLHIQADSHSQDTSTLDYKMAYFSVEWLSKSFYDEEKVQSETKDFAEESSSQSASTSPNNSLDSTSGSEVEVDLEKVTVRRRKMRTNFTEGQLRKLEKTFRKHQYLTTSQRRKLSNKLQLGETQVKTWFQNRRMKLKREIQDSRSHFASAPMALLPPPLFQHPSLGGQLPRAPLFLQPHFQHPFVGGQLPRAESRPPLLLQQWNSNRGALPHPQPHVYPTNPNVHLSFLSIQSRNL